MTWAAASFLVLGICAVAMVLRLAKRVAHAQQIMFGALAGMRDKSMSDRQKEKAMLRASGRMLLATVVVVGCMGRCIAIPVGLVWLAEQGGLVSLEATLDKTLEWRFLLLATVVVTAAWLLLRGRKTEEAPNAG